jgi:Uma2 family endonuclease
MSRTSISIGAADNGRQMSLAEFDSAEGQEGFVYELSRGVITVVQVPDIKHLVQVDAIREQFYDYRRLHADRIHTLATSGECKIVLHDLDSERHPDLAVYGHGPLETGDELWATWIPDIAIEVVSPSSVQRDYVEKREEYFRFGILEYWIVDAEKQQMLALRRTGGRWGEQVVDATGLYRTRLLPDFQLALAPIFAAAARV